MLSNLRGLALLTACALAGASPARAGDDNQLWTTLNATAKLDEHWRVQEEAVGRFSDKRDGLYEFESNTLIGYALTKQITGWIGYTRDPQYAAGHFTIMEQRAREQVTLDKIAMIGGGSLSVRVRTEQRWRDGLDGAGWRVRPYARMAFPIANAGKTHLVLSHESFINLNATAFQFNGFERMRNLIAVSAPITRTVAIEVGYMNQYAVVHGGPNTDDHILSTALVLTF